MLVLIFTGSRVGSGIGSGWFSSLEILVVPRWFLCSSGASGVGSVMDSGMGLPRPGLKLDTRF